MANAREKVFLYPHFFAGYESAGNTNFKKSHTEISR